MLTRPNLQARSNAIGSEIITLEDQINTSNLPGLDERLEKLYRENLKLCEEVQHIIEGKSNDMNLLDSIKILAGLREASEAQETAAVQLAQGSRVASGKLNRGNKKGGASNKAAATSAATATLPSEEIAAEPEVPSPRLRLGTTTKDTKSRAGSAIPSTREVSVKIEADGAESVASSADTSASATTKTATANAYGAAGTAGAAGGRATGRITLTKGEIVFCRHASIGAIKPGADPPEGEGILCRVTAVTGEGKQRRYEVQDADTTASNPPPAPQRASVNQLIKIPETNSGLGNLGKGRGVLAMYPDTTTFYKAEVGEGWKEGGGAVRLNFQDDDVMREMERRFVLTEK